MNVPGAGTDGSGPPPEVDVVPAPCRGRRLATALLLVPAAFALSAAYLVPPLHGCNVGGRSCSAFCESPELVRGLFGAAAATFLALFVWSCLSRLRVRPHRPVVAWLGLIVMIGSCGFANMLSTFGVHLHRESIVVDGVTYRVGRTWDGGHWMAIERGRTWPRTFVEVVASNAFDEYEWPRLIRAEGQSSEEYAAGPDGRVYALHRGACLVGYDPRDPERGRAIDLGLLPGELDLREISPFALIGPTGAGRQSDVDAIVEGVARARASRERGEQFHFEWWPKENVVLPELAHPNPWVRETAARFIREGGELLYPEALKRLPK